MVSSSLFAFSFSLSFCYLISSSKVGSRTRFISKDDLSARQSTHSRPTPRIGGVAIALAGAIAALIMWRKELLPTQGALVLFSALPVFVAGVKEDFFRNVSAKTRLASAALSGFVAYLLLGVWIDRAEPAWFGTLLSIGAIGIPFTVFISAGLCHAFNLIDGLNGFCSGTAILISLGLSYVAAQSGQADLLPVLSLIIAVLAGFFLLNYPFGKVFLGDAGAYSVGHILVWIGVVMISRNTEVSPWALTLIFFWPFADTLFAIVRRWRSGANIDEPDRLHFHHLVMRLILVTWLGRGHKSVANPLATLMLLPMVSLTVATGAWFWNNGRAAGYAILVFGVIFVGMHFAMRAIAPRRRVRTQKV